MKTFNKTFSEWALEEEKKLKRRNLGKEKTKAKRTYIHFDKRSNGTSLILLRDSFKPENIARHSFWPFLKVSIKTIKLKNDTKTRRKRKTKIRNVYYASHRDALIYSWYSFQLNKLYSEKVKFLNIDQCSIAYRKIPRVDKPNANKCNIHFAKEVFDFIKSSNQECVAFVSDITSFFDNLDHEHLKKEWINMLGVQSNYLPKDHEVIYKNLTQFKYVDAEKLYKQFGIKFKKKKYIDEEGRTKVYTCPTNNDGKIIKNILQKRPYHKEFQDKVVKSGLIKGNENRNKIKKCPRGIMQGAPISATLSNIYMISFDKYINELITNLGGIYRRYSDDIVVVTKLSDYKQVKEAVISKIKNYELEIQEDKTKTTFFLRDQSNLLRGYKDLTKKSQANMQYLGFDFNGQNIFIRCSSLTKYYRRMKSSIRKAASMAYGTKSKSKNNNNKILKKRLYKKYIYSGRRSFISYAIRSNETMGDNTIKKQLNKRLKIMKEYLSLSIAKQNGKRLIKYLKSRKSS